MQKKNYQATVMEIIRGQKYKKIERKRKWLMALITQKENFLLLS